MEERIIATFCLCDDLLQSDLASGKLISSAA